MKTFSFVLALFYSLVVQSANLEIHYINTGQGGSTLIKGPNGTSILYDFGVKHAKKSLLPYLKSLGFSKDKPLDFAVLSHNHKDHFFGYKSLTEGGINVRIANYGNSDKADGKQLNSHWFAPSTKTLAGPVRSIPVGLRIALGKDAEAIVVAANGIIFDGTVVNAHDENDRSVSLFIRMGKFEFIIDGDMGGGSEACSFRDTNQSNVQSAVARALINEHLIDETNGVDVMHVAHHGSESSTSYEYVELIKPEVALISVGYPNKKYLHPRKDVIESVLKGHRKTQCGTAHVVKHIFQTDRGSPGCFGESTDENSRCYAESTIGGDLVLVTDGETKYTIKLTGRLLANGKFEIQQDKASETDIYFN